MLVLDHAKDRCAYCNRWFCRRYFCAATGGGFRSAHRPFPYRHTIRLASPASSALYARQSKRHGTDRDGTLGDGALGDVRKRTARRGVARAGLSKPGAAGDFPKRLLAEFVAVAVWLSKHFHDGLCQDTREPGPAPVSAAARPQCDGRTHRERSIPDRGSNGAVAKARRCAWHGLRLSRQGLPEGNSRPAGGPVADDAIADPGHGNVSRHHSPAAAGLRAIAHAGSTVAL